MMESPTTPQKRKASVSYTSSPAKRARAISFSVKVSHDAPPVEVVGDPEIFLPLKNPDACLRGLPEELLANVVQNFEHNQDVLAKLCRVDKRCRRMAEALLYKKIQGGQYWNKNDRTELISNNTGLAKNTKGARFVFNAQVPSWRKDYKPLARADLVRALSNVSNIQELWIEETTTQEAIDRNEVAQQLGWLQLLNKAISGSAGTLQNNFEHLKCLRIRAMCLSVAEISSIFHLPALEVLHLEDVSQTTPFESWSIPEASCSVRELSVFRSVMDIEALVKIVTSMKALKRFSYSRDTSRWGGVPFEDNSTANTPVHSWALLGDALRKHKLSLEMLNLAEHTDELLGSSDDQDDRGFGTLGSFQDFTKLTSVTVAIEALLDFHTGEDELSVYLPPQLKDFATDLPLREEATMACYSSVLASLRKVLSASSEVMLELTVDEYLPFQQLRLSKSLEPLQNAGVVIHIFDNVYGNCLTVDHLRARERDDSEDESGDDSEEEESKEELEEEYLESEGPSDDEE
jgi:hypothetical protein